MPPRYHILEHWEGSMTQIALLQKLEPFFTSVAELISLSDTALPKEQDILTWAMQLFLEETQLAETKAEAITTPW